jgi:hypothetical protein
LFFISAGTFTLLFLTVFIIPFWMTMATIKKFSPKMADKIATFWLEF